MLVKACIEEHAVSANRSPQSAAELLLAIAGLAGGERLLGIERTVAQIVERAAMPFVVARLGYHVENPAARPAEFGTVGVRRDPELLDDFVAELIRRAITSARLGVKGIVVIGAVHQEVVLEAADTAEREIAIRVGGETARVLRYSRGKQREIGEATPVQRQVRNRPLRNDGRNRDPLCFLRLGLSDYGDIFRPADGRQPHLHLLYSANVELNGSAARCRHARRPGAHYVAAGQQHAEAEIASGVRHGLAVKAVFRIDDGHRSRSNASSGDVLDDAIERRRAILSDCLTCYEKDRQQGERGEYPMDAENQHGGTESAQ